MASKAAMELARQVYEFFGREGFANDAHAKLAAMIDDAVKPIKSALAIRPHDPDAATCKSCAALGPWAIHPDQ